MKKVLIIVGAIILAGGIAVGSFYCGMAYQQNQATQARNEFMRSRGLDPNAQNSPAGGPGQAPGQGVGGFGGGATGQIESIDGDTITLTTAGNTTNVALIDTTKVIKSVEGSMTDLQVGMQVLVSGQRDTKGNITATQIMVMTGNTTTPGVTP